MTKAILALEDGSVFEGESFAAAGEVTGEVIFNTSMTGYQEILTDPSYKGQIVVMTYPLIGNYGVNSTDVESAHPQAEGFVVRSLSPVASNWRKQESLEGWLERAKTVAIQGVDTRALTLLLRQRGALKGIVSTVDLDGKRLVEKARSSPGLIGRDLVKEVTREEIVPWPESPRQKARFRVVAIDCGMKAHIPRMLTEAGCQVTMAPATVSADQILKLRPQGLFLSNGPGDPEGLPYLVSTVRQMIGKLPIFGICLGHQVLGLALGGKTYKLKFGHHGSNHPVLDLQTGRVEITAQNHGFSVDPSTIPNQAVEVTHLNLNDKTCEGMKHKEYPIFSVQYHPEASPGPHDAGHLFQRFVKMMETGLLLLALAGTGVSTSTAWAQQEKEAPSPIQVRFETVNASQPIEGAFVHLIVERKPELLSLKTPAERSLELFLRLPQGVRLLSTDWKPIPQSPQEKKDPTGTWSLYEKAEKISLQESDPLLLARVPLSLSVIEDGTNWVITARARLIEPGKSWTAFGVLFASRQKGQAKFHMTPQIPQPNAQEDGS